ncbi:MAG: hypothetical protein AVDCRST_MAG17-475, partial [uncultured Solirubrobacterales bacterium]
AVHNPPIPLPRRRRAELRAPERVRPCPVPLGNRARGRDGRAHGADRRAHPVADPGPRHRCRLPLARVHHRRQHRRLPPARRRRAGGEPGGLAAVADAGRDSGGMAHALDAPAPPGRPEHDPELLRHLHRVSQPEELPAGPARRQLRRRSARPRPCAARRERPGRLPAQHPRHRRGRPRAVLGLPALSLVRAALGRRGAGVDPQGGDRGLVRHRRQLQLDPRSAELLPGALARTCVRRPAAGRSDARHGGLEPPAGPARRPVAIRRRPDGQRLDPEHRRLRLAARLGALLGGSDRVAAACADRSPDRPLGHARPDHRRDDLLRLALRGGRHRRPAHRGALGVPRGPRDRLARLAAEAGARLLARPRAARGARRDRRL